MMLSPTDREEFLERLSRLGIEEVRKECGGLGMRMVLPMAAVVQITGLTRQAVPKHLPVTKMGRNKAGVILQHLRTYQERNTTYPKGWKSEPEEAGKA